MQTAAQHVFDATATSYNNERARLIPGYDRFYAAAIELIPSAAQRILDLGAGTGLLTTHIRASFPTAHIELVDFSAPMLELARQRLSDDANVAFTLADYTAVPLPAELDAVVSALSIHHLEDDAKQALFHSVFRALRPGGLFINADHIAGPTPALEATYQQRWLDEVRRLGATEQQIADSLFRQQADRRSSVSDQLDWLTAAGFVDVDCWYKDGSFAVFCGVRP
jgi:tRNA (cmo5U34)-methyltransferase